MRQPLPRSALPAMLLGVLLLPLPAFGQSGTAAELLEQAASYEKEQKFTLALDTLAELLKREPGHVTAYQRWLATRQQDRIDRRYREPGMQQRLAELSFEKAVHLYGEVANAIADHYVQPVTPRVLWQAGVRQIDLALANRSFVKIAFAVTPADEALTRCRVSLTERQKDAVSADRTALEKKVQAFAIGLQQDLGVHPTATVMEFIHAACETLDPYGAYLDPRRLTLEKTAARPDVAGVGLEPRQLRDQLIVASVVADGPAARAGVQMNESLIAIDGVPANLLTAEEATLRLLGTEGSSVSVQVKGILEARPRTVQLTRRPLPSTTVADAKLLDEASGIGYVRLTAFASTTAEELDGALAKLAMNGMRSLIVDLRDNPGGNLEAAVQVADRFLASGVVAATQGRSPGIDRTYEAAMGQDLDVPLVVLINGGTASAAEVLAGAVREHRRATLVGARTYGKNTVQFIFALRTETAGVRSTAAHYWLPFHKPLPENGLTPDVLADELPMSQDFGMPMSSLQLQQWQLDVALRTAKELLERK